MSDAGTGTGRGTGTGTKEAPDLDSLFSVNPDGSRRAIHPADVRGRFQKLKRVLWPALIVLYLAVPWLAIDGRPVLLVDIPQRHFWLLGSSFTAADFWLAFFFVTGIGFTLFVVSALFGRLWCGYACPQTVFLEGVFRRIEGWIEGSPRRRQQLDRAPWNAAKVARRGGKLLVFAAISVVLAHTALGYFMPVRDVLHAMTSAPSENWRAFVFTALFSAAVFVNYTWFREQLCIVVCPYGRLQGMLADKHTIVIGYDRRRGEPRGKVKESGRGDCVDCGRCVAVCPTGIDIRNGTQLECIGCANCIDACDDIMEKVGRARGLIRYDSENGLLGERRRFVRPRLWLYAVLLIAGTAVFAAAAHGRTDFEAALLRLQGSPYTIDGEVVTNAFSLHLQNKSPSAETFHVEPAAVPGLSWVIPSRDVTLPALADQRIPVFARLERESMRPGLRVALTVQTAREQRELSMPFLGPNAPR